MLAGIINSLRLTGKKKEDCKVVVNGAGSAGVAITKLLLTYGFTHVTMCDRLGIIGKDYPNLNWMQQKMTEVTNLENAQGTLADALKGADIFVGVSAPGIVTEEMVASMNKDSILFAMANPVPEIMPDVAKAAGARRALRLPVGGAFHSPLMEPAKQELEKAISEAPFQTPVCPIYQNVDAKPYTDPAQIKANLIAQLTAPVRWTYIVKNMLADGVTEFTELGPGTVLQGLIRKVNPEAVVESKSAL